MGQRRLRSRLRPGDPDPNRACTKQHPDSVLAQSIVNPLDYPYIWQFLKRIVTVGAHGEGSTPPGSPSPELGAGAAHFFS